MNLSYHSNKSHQINLSHGGSRVWVSIRTDVVSDHVWSRVYGEVGVPDCVKKGLPSKSVKLFNGGVESCYLSLQKITNFASTSTPTTLYVRLPIL